MTTEHKPFGALHGIRIIDLTQMLAGPYATMMLADHGADVIKIEAPSGDMARTGGPFRPDDAKKILGGYFQSVNRNKKSVCLDLKTIEGAAALKKLILEADAVVENFRDGVMERLGLAYEELERLNPRLVYGALRGFGDHRTGASPYLDWPAFDVVSQAMGGIMALTGPDAATPTKIGPGVGDIIPGIMLAFGLLAAIHHAQRTGEGQFVDVSMVDSILAVCERMVWQHSIQGSVPGPEGNHHPFFCPFGMFPTTDGYVTIAAQEDMFFAKLCTVLGAPELAEDSRFAKQSDRRKNRDAVIDQISKLTRSFSKSELSVRLGGKVPFGPVMNIAEIATDPHFAAREMLVPVSEPGVTSVQVAGVPIKMTKTPGGVFRRGPQIGEHTRNELKRVGLSDAEIDIIIKNRAASAD